MIVTIRKTVFLSIILWLLPLAMWGQNDPYRAEIGVQTGLNIYSGDVNSIADPGLYAKNMKNLNADFGLTFRYRFNKRLAMRLGYDYSKVKGNFLYRDAKETFSANLNNPLHLLDIWGEFNFFDLENNPYKRFSKRYSPYIFLGIGGLVSSEYKDTDNNNFSFTIPYGLGIKIKFSERWNFNIQLTNRLQLGDNLEGVRAFDNPTPVTVANPMNHDLLSGIGIGITYDFWTRDCNCMQNSFSRGKKPATNKIAKQKKTKKRDKK